MLEGEEEEEEIENLFEKIMEENFSNLMKEVDMRVPNKMYTKRTTPRHIIIKMPKVKDKERIVKTAGEKQSYLQRSSHKTISGWQEVFKVMKSKDLQPRLFYPAKLSFRIEGQIRCFPDKVKLKEFIINQALII